MKTNIRTTIIFGLLSALCVIPFTHLPIPFLGWPMICKLFILLNLVIYSLMLCRWSNTHPIDIMFPVLLLLGVALWPGTYAGYILIALAVFSWIRSGICFKKNISRGILAEIVTLGGTGILLFWWPSSTLAQPLAVLLFFLVQTLYFFIIPDTNGHSVTSFSTDSFEQASREMERLLRSR